MRIRPLPLLLSFLTVVPVFADDVYLVNGRVFEGVIAETTDSQVRIRMQGGTLSLPKSQVLRVEAGDSNLGEYLRRKEALKKGGSARDWLELARWARSRELGQGSRDAALVAAELDPTLEGLGPILRGHGYVLDEQIGRWSTNADFMRRRGFMPYNGAWISREEYASRLREREEEEARRQAARQEAARAAREERLAALTELALVRDLSRQNSAPPPYAYQAPLFVYPGFWIAPPHHHKPPRKPDPASFTHVPGSLIPGNDFFPGLH